MPMAIVEHLGWPGEHKRLHRVASPLTSRLSSHSRTGLNYQRIGVFFECL